MCVIGEYKKICAKVVIKSSQGTVDSFKSDLLQHFQAEMPGIEPTTSSLLLSMLTTWPITHSIYGGPMSS